MKPQKSPSTGNAISAYVVFMILPLLFGTSCNSLPTRKAELRPIDLVLAEATISVPKRWFELRDSSRNNFHMDQAQLQRVEDGEGEWDKEYAEIVNNVLPFSKCVAHLGDDGWGSNAVSYGDIQMRIYLGGGSLPSIKERIEKIGLPTALSFSGNVSLRHDKYKQWKRSTLTYDLWYKHYGGRATINFYSNVFENEVVTLVFMYCLFPTDQLRQTQEIVDSFSLQKDD